MSLSARNWALPLHMKPHPQTRQLVPMKPVEKAVLLCLAEKENHEDGYARPGFATIARETCWSRRSVIAAVKALADSGMIYVVRQRTGSKNTPNHYYLPLVTREEREKDPRWMDAENRHSHGALPWLDRSA